MHTATPNTTLITYEQLLNIVPVSSRTIRRWIASGRFPSAKISHGRVRLWPADTIHNWIESGGASQH